MQRKMDLFDKTTGVLQTSALSNGDCAEKLAEKWTPAFFVAKMTLHDW